MKKCELCESPARMNCESDQASLCWDCDSKVHGANFLVARHSRNLLCHACQSPTPWSATGTELGPTVSICQKCSAIALPSEERENRESDVLDIDDDAVDDDEGESEEEDEEDEEERENQVVPGCPTPPSQLPIVMTSIGEEMLCDDAANGEDFPNSCSSMISLKRNHECSSDLGFQEKFSRLINRRENSPVSNTSDNVDPCIVDADARPLKERRIEPFLDRTIQGRTGMIKESIEKIEREIASGYGTSTGIVGLRRLSRNPEAI